MPRKAADVEKSCTCCNPAVDVDLYIQYIYIYYKYVYVYIYIHYIYIYIYIYVRVYVCNLTIYNSNRGLVIHRLVRGGTNL